MKSLKSTKNPTGRRKLARSSENANPNKRRVQPERGRTATTIQNVSSAPPTPPATPATPAQSVLSFDFPSPLSLPDPSSSEPRRSNRIKKTTNDILDELAVINLPGTILYLQPPPPSVDTDEDSGEEDEGGQIKNIHRNMLTAVGSLARLANGDEIGGDDDEGEDASREYYGDEILDHEWEDLRNLHKKVYEDWVELSTDGDENSRQDLDTSELRKRENEFVFPNYDFHALNVHDMSPVSLFELFFDDEVFQHLRDQMELYHQQQQHKNGRKLVKPFSVEELKKCFGILIVSGVNSKSTCRDFWSNDKALKNVLVQETMSRDRFDQFVNNCHWADNTNLDMKDSYCKIRPLVDMLRKRFREFYFPDDFDISYDESMIKYFGRHKCKQWIPIKPIRSGFKALCATTVGGYCIDFLLCQGKDPFVDPKIAEIVGKNTAPLVHFILRLKYKNIPYRFFHDNAFTSQTFLDFCRYHGYSATGTSRMNRLPKGVNLDIKLTRRGDYSCWTSAEAGMLITKWHDNRDVITLSNCFGRFNQNGNLDRVDRYVKDKGGIVSLSQPHLTAKYSKSMGGTDRMNQHVSNFRISIRSKKWYWSIFTWLVDVAIQNAWLLYRKHGDGVKKFPLKNFKLRIANHYCSLNPSPPKGIGKVPHFDDGNNVSTDLRFDGRDHLIRKYDKTDTVNGKSKDVRQHCKFVDTNKEKCQKKTSYYCFKCKVALCSDPCFFTYHTKPN